jgi:glycine/D-amino acid oxidase-like deaminating enzyme
VRIVEDTPVTGIEIEDGRITGVETPQGRIECEVVVAAPGSGPARSPPPSASTCRSSRSSTST